MHDHPQLATSSGDANPATLLAAALPTKKPFSCKVRVNLWDLAGPPAYLEVRNEFYKDSQGALLVYDATNRPSFEALGAWLQEAQQYGAPQNMVSRRGAGDAPRP
jgi:GTPase SAR1 family protein